MKEDLLLDIYDNARNGGSSEESLMSNLVISAERYSRLTEISSGGMKTIYKCHDAHTDREIVLVTPKESSLNELFVREGRLNAFLQHPNISPVFDIGLLEDGRPYFTSKLISGSPLNELNIKGDTDKIIDIVIKICEAVSYSHSRSIVHQDLKPDNVMIDNFGEVIIIDWGLAEIDDSVFSGECSILDKELSSLKLYTIPDEMRKLRGTPGFISPQRYKSNKVSVLNDIYSMGGLLYSLLAGQNPPKFGFTNDCSQMLFKQNISPGLKAICEKSLHSNSSERYQSANEMLDDLKRFRQGYAPAAESPSIWRLITLLYSRNRRFCLVSVFALILIFGITVTAFIQVNKSKNHALVEKEKAVEANKKNVTLLTALQEKEVSRQKFMKLSAANQLESLKRALSKRNYFQIPEMLDFILKLDPDSKEICKFKAKFEFARFDWKSAKEYYIKADLKEAVDLLNSIDPENPQSILDHMTELGSFISNDAMVYFNGNCVKKFADLDVKARFYEHYLLFYHKGMKKLPRVIITQEKEGVSVKISDNFAIRHCGPIHILNPVKLDFSNSNFFSVSELQECTELKELNLNNTPLVSIMSLQLEKLEKLVISNTVIKVVVPENMPGITFMNISHSDFKQLSNLDDFTNLKEVIVDTSQAKRLKSTRPVKVTVVE